jgi:rhodanese-related sulfurtransferase/DNA-binding MarR family transcriptional regulator
LTSQPFYYSIIKLNIRYRQSKREFKDACYDQLARLGKALSSAKRLELLDLLSQAERTVEALAAETDMSVANTSQHLQALQQAGLVTTSRRGRYVVYRLADALVADFFRSYRVLADDRFAEIERLRRDFFGREGEIDAIDRKTLFDRVRQKKAVVIDVRPLAEFKAGHIAGAIPIPIDDLKQRLSELPRSKEIVAYCRGPFCVFAKEAVDLLRAAGFRAARLEDSVHDWVANGLPVAKAIGSEA